MDNIQLFILKDNKWVELHIKEDVGITIKKSLVDIKDLKKSNSYSYTFEIILDKENKETLGFKDDISIKNIKIPDYPAILKNPFETLLKGTIVFNSIKTDDIGVVKVSANLNSNIYSLNNILEDLKLYDLDLYGLDFRLHTTLSNPDYLANIGMFRPFISYNMQTSAELSLYAAFIDAPISVLAKSLWQHIFAELNIKVSSSFFETEIDNLIIPFHNGEIVLDDTPLHWDSNPIKYIASDRFSKYNQINNIISNNFLTVNNSVVTPNTKHSFEVNNLHTNYHNNSVYDVFNGVQNFNFPKYVAQNSHFELKQSSSVSYNYSADAINKYKAFTNNPNTQGIIKDSFYAYNRRIGEFQNSSRYYINYNNSESSILSEYQTRFKLDAVIRFNKKFFPTDDKTYGVVFRLSNPYHTFDIDPIKVTGVDWDEANILPAVIKVDGSTNKIETPSKYYYLYVNIGEEGVVGNNSILQGEVLFNSNDYVDIKYSIDFDEITFNNSVYYGVYLDYFTHYEKMDEFINNNEDEYPFEVLDMHLTDNPVGDNLLTVKSLFPKDTLVKDLLQDLIDMYNLIIFYDYDEDTYVIERYNKYMNTDVNLIDLTSYVDLTTVREIKSDLDKNIEFNYKENSDIKSSEFKELNGYSFGSYKIDIGSDNNHKIDLKTASVFNDVLYPVVGRFSFIKLKYDDNYYFPQDIERFYALMYAHPDYNVAHPHPEYEEESVIYTRNKYFTNFSSSLENNQSLSFNDTTRNNLYWNNWSDYVKLMNSNDSTLISLEAEIPDWIFYKMNLNSLIMITNLDNTTSVNLFRINTLTYNTSSKKHKLELIKVLDNKLNYIETNYKYFISDDIFKTSNILKLTSNDYNFDVEVVEAGEPLLVQDDVFFDRTLIENVRGVSNGFNLFSGMQKVDNWELFDSIQTIQSSIYQFTGTDIEFYNLGDGIKFDLRGSIIIEITSLTEPDTITVPYSTETGLTLLRMHKQSGNTTGQAIDNKQYHQAEVIGNTIRYTFDIDFPITSDSSYLYGFGINATYLHPDINGKVKVDVTSSLAAISLDAGEELYRNKINYVSIKDEETGVLYNKDDFSLSNIQIKPVIEDIDDKLTDYETYLKDESVYIIFPEEDNKIEIETSSSNEPVAIIDYNDTEENIYIDSTILNHNRTKTDEVLIADKVIKEHIFNNTFNLTYYYPNTGDYISDLRYEVFDEVSSMWIDITNDIEFGDTGLEMYLGNWEVIGNGTDFNYTEYRVKTLGNNIIKQGVIIKTLA